MTSKNTKNCLICKTPFKGRRDAKTCSPACRKRLQRHLQAQYNEVTKRLESSLGQEFNRVASALFAKHVIHTPLAIGNEQGSVPASTVEPPKTDDSVVPAPPEPEAVSKPLSDIPVQPSTVVEPPEVVEPTEPAVAPEVVIPPQSIATETTPTESVSVNEPISTTSEPIEQVPISTPDSSSLESPEPETPVTGQPEVVTPSPEPKQRISIFNFNRPAFVITSIATALILIIGVGGLLILNHKNNKQGGTEASSQKVGAYSSNSLSLSGLSSSQLQIGQANTLEVNGQLKVNKGLVLTPSSQPSQAQTGELYFDQSAKAPYYYNGSQFISLAPGQSVTSIGGSSGAITLGNNLSVVNNQLDVANSLVQKINNFANSNGVSSLTGNANQINVSSSTGNITLSLPQDIATTSSPTFQGLAISGLGSGLVQSSSSGLLSSGAVDRNSSDFSGTLSVTNGGTGVGSLTTNGVLYGNGTGAIQATSSAANSVLITGAGSIPSLSQTLPLAVQGNITQTGVLNSGSITAGFGTISTVNNITTTALVQGGSLEVTGGNFTVDASGNVIANGMVNIEGSGGLAVGVAGSITGKLVLDNTSNTHTTTLEGLASASQNQVITIPASSAASDTVCLLTLGNCVGTGGSVTASGGTQNFITKFTNAGGTQLGNSLLYDNGVSVGVNNSNPNASYILDVTGNIHVSGTQTFNNTLTVTAGGASITGNIVQSGTGTFSTGTGNVSLNGNTTESGTLQVQGSGGLTVGNPGSVAGNLNLANASSAREVVLQGLNPSGSGNSTIQLPSIAGGSTDTVCLVALGNCAGSGSGVTTTGGSTNTIAMFTGSQAIGNSVITQSGSAITVAGTLAVTGANSLTLGTTGTNTGSILFQGSTGASGTLTLIGPANPSTNTLTLPNETGTLCSTGSVCTGYAPVTGGSYIAKNTNDTSSASFVGNLLGLTNTNTGAAGVLGLTNNGTNSALSVLQSGTSEPSAGQALILANNNTTTPTGNLIDLQNKGTSELHVDVSGDLTTIGNIQGVNLTTSGTVTFNNLPLSGGTTVLCVDGSDILKACSGGAGSGSYILNGTNSQVANFNIQSGNPSSVTATIQGANGQTADILDLKTTTTPATVLSVGSTGSALFQNSTNSTTAFQIQNAGGTSNLLVADTSDTKLGIAAAPASGGSTLQVGGDISLATLDAANTSTFLCRNTSNQIASCNTTGTGAAFVQGGNSFGAQAVLGTNDSNSLALETGGTTRAVLDTSGNLTLQQASTISTSTGNLAVEANGTSTLTLDTTGAGTVGIATTNATAVNIGNTTTNVATTINGTTLIKPTSGHNSTTAFQIQNASSVPVLTVDTTNSLTTLRGSLDNASIGSDLRTGNCSGTHWSGSGTGPYTHSSGSVAALTCTITGGVIVGDFYQITYNATPSQSTTTVTPKLGGFIGSTTTGTVTNQVQIFQAGTTANPTFTISSSTDTGTISNISIKQVTISKPVLEVQDSSGVDQLEVRATSNGDAFGEGSLQADTTGNGNSAFGAFTLSSNTTGSQNTAVGDCALCSTTTASFNTALGYDSLALNTTGNANTAIGNLSLLDNSTGASNTAIGDSTLELNSTGSHNTAIGESALVDNTTGNFNTGTGNSALINNSTGSQNTALGYQSLFSNTAGGSSVAIGQGALFANTSVVASFGTITGGSGYTSGTYNNVTMTDVSGTMLTAPVANITVSGGAVTAVTLVSGGTGVDTNTVLSAAAASIGGTGSGFSVTVASVTSGQNNIALGYQAGYTSVTTNANVTGSNNAFIGYNSGPGTTTQLQNATAIGTYSTVNENNALVLGCVNGTNGCTANTLVGVDTATPAATLDVQAVSTNVGLNVNTTGSGNLLQLQNSNTPVATITSTGAVTLQNSSDSTTAFQIQNHAGTSNLLVADTTNSKIGIATAPASGGSTLQVGGDISLTTLDTANTSTYLCRNSSNQIATCNSTGSGTAFDQGGNSFGAQAVLGTNDSNSLALETGGTTRAVLDTSGNLTFQQASTISTSTGNLTIQANGTSTLALDSSGAGTVTLGGTNASTVTVGNDTSATTTTIESGTSGITLSPVGGSSNKGVLVQPDSNTTLAFQIQNSGGTSNLLVADTTNSKIGIAVAPTAGGSTLQVGGDISLTTLDTANTSTFLCRNSSNQIAGCSTTGSGAAFVQGGNSFGAQAILGTNDSNSLALETGGANKAVLDTSGNLTFQQASTVSTSTGNLTVEANGTSTLALDATGAGTVSVGNTNATTVNLGASNSSSLGQTINVGQSTGMNSINIGSSSGTNSVTVGSTNSTSALTLQAGTGNLSITTQGGTLGVGNNAVAQTLAIGNTTGATTLTLQGGTGGVNLGTGGVANTIQIGNTTGAVAQTIDIGNNSTASSTSTVAIGSTVGTSPVTINSGTSGITLAPAGGSTNTGVLVAPGTNTTKAFVVQNTGNAAVLNVDTTDGTVNVEGATNSEATLGSEMFTSSESFSAPSGGWTSISGTGSSATATHTSGNTNTIVASPALTIVAGNTYQVTFEVTNTPTSGTTVTAMIGGTSGTAISGKDTTPEIQIIKATTTGNLTFTPSNTSNAVVTDVSVKLVTLANPALQVQDSVGDTVLQIGSADDGGIGADTFVGLNSGQTNTTGQQNTGFGYGALQSNTAGLFNTAQGYNALQFETVGIANTAVGESALMDASTASDNTGVGAGSLFYLTTGGDNTAVGTDAGVTNNTANAITTGTNNTYLGYLSGPNVGVITNSTAIGAFATVSGNNSLVLGCVNGLDTCGTSTKVGVDVISPSFALSVQGDVSASDSLLAGGGAKITGLTVPAAPTITQGGTAGSTNYSYAIAAVNAFGGSTLISTATQTTTGNATLTGSNFNTIKWTPVAFSGIFQYKIYRTASSGTPSSTGLIGTVSGNYSDNVQMSFNDTGIAATTAAPTIDTSGELDATGTALFQSATNSSTAFQVQDTSGDNYIQADTNGANLYLGNTGIASTIQIGNTTGAVTQTINIGNNSTSSSTNNVTVGSTVAGTTTIQSSGISQSITGSNETIKTSTNSTTAFQIQNSNAASILNVDTSTTKNLITNGDFENGDGTTGWSSKGSSNLISQVTTQAWQGNGSMQVATTAASGDGAQYAFTFSPSTQYTLSFYAKTSTGTGISDFNFGRQDNGSDIDCKTGQSVANTWGFYSCSFTTGATISGSNIYIKKTGTSAENIFIDAVQLQTGGAATPFNPGGDIQLNGIVDSPVTFQNTINSTSAFLIQNATGSSSFKVDTVDANFLLSNLALISSSTATNALVIQNNAGTVVALRADTNNGRVGINSTSAPANTLSVNTLTTADSLAQIAVGTAATTNKGIVVQAVASQTADLLDMESSTGSVLFGISATGHIITGGGALPAATAQTADGTSGTCTVAGDDTAGTVTITPGGTGIASGAICQVNFTTAFGVAPRPVISPTNGAASAVQAYVSASATGSFTISFNTTPSAQAYTLNWFSPQ